MLNNIKNSIMILLIFLLSIQTALFSISGEEILDNVKEKFSNLKTFESEFTQTQFWELADEKSETTGKFYFKKEDSFRIENGEDFILSDGKTVWRYSKANNQVLIEEVKEDNENESSMLPHKIFFQFTTDYDLVDYFTKKSKDGNEENDIFVIKLATKKGEEKFINEVKAYISSDFITKKIEYKDIDENTTIFEFNKVKIDKPIEEQKFIFKVKDDKIEIIDLR